MTNPTTLFYAGLGLFALTVVLMAAVRNRLIRRRLLFSLVLLVGMILLHLAVADVPAIRDSSFPSHGHVIAGLFFSLALINVLVTMAFNPWSQDTDRAPAIVQDAMVLVLFAIVATFAFKDDARALTSSAIAAAVVGFALQETLGNAFAGLAIQIDKPFRVGHWISLSTYEGLVTGVTWRATKIRTKNGNLVIIPNNLMAREPITNYSEPVAPTRLMVDVGAAYGAPPNEVRDAIYAALRQVPRVLKTPAPDVLVDDFGSSAIMYKARFWIDDFAKDSQAKDEVRTMIYYEFRRQNIEIPWPIQVEYDRLEVPVDLAAARERFLHAITAVPVLAPLAADAHRALAAAAVEHLYGTGEVIVREGEPGQSMFIVVEGRVSITVGASAKEVAVTEAGGYFGEMSLLTGEPRTATVTAKTDTTVLEIKSAPFATYVKSHPQVLDQLATSAAKRRRELDDTRAGDVQRTPVETGALVQLMRKFFGLN